MSDKKTDLGTNHPIKKTTGRFTSFDGTEIYYEIRGEGPPMILTYGIGCLINHWRYQIEYFARTHTVINYDIRGHHKSAIPENRENVKIDCAAEDLVKLAEHLNIKKFTGWGHSFGCQVMLATYDKRPDLFNGMIFVNGFSHNPFDDRVDVEKLIRMTRRFRNYYEHVPNFLKYIWKKGIDNPLSIPLSGLSGGFNLSLTPLHDIEIYGRGVTNMDPDVFGRCFMDLITWDGRRVLPSIKCPSLIIAGDKDLITPTERQEFMHNQIPDCEILRVPYGSHCTQLDLPELLNLRVEKFLNVHNIGDND